MEHDSSSCPQMQISNKNTENVQDLVFSDKTKQSTKLFMLKYLLGYVKYKEKGLNFGSPTTVLSCEMTMPRATACCWAVNVKEKNLLLEFISFLTTFTLPKLKPNVKGKWSEDIQDVQKTWQQWQGLSCKTISKVVSNSGSNTGLTTAVLGHYSEA